MISNKWRLLKYAAKLFDLGVLVAAFLFATFVLLSSPHGMSLSGFMALRIKLGNCLLFALLLASWHNLFVLCGLYVSKRLTRRSTEIYGVCKAALLASLFLLVMAQTLRIKMVSLPFVLIFFIVCGLLMASGRIVARTLLVALRSRGRNSRFVLIVGTNERAMAFAEAIRVRPEIGYQIVGFVDDDWAGIERFEVTGHKRCCDFSGLASFLRHNVVDEAAIYLPLRSYYEHAAQLVSVCEHHGIAIRVDSQVFNLRSQDASSMQIDQNSEMPAVVSSAQSGPALIKRMIDCVLSLVALIVLAPLFLAIGLVVKFTSDGPTFFRQTRVGLNKRMFNIYKFRTMFADAERLQDALLSMNEMTGPVFKINQDPRVTPIGRILRKTSLDELPQLYNVLKGEMSLVGPRAMSLRDYQLFDTDWHRRRFSVKPGITCLWQIAGRNSVPFEQWMELDLQYIDKWSLWLDLKILAKTVPAVLRGTGAA
jgi:exopolysaccharide biosynthesis polyprenyl glycosylphosphotransferase